MSVYVDGVRFKYRNMVMCHMWADTPADLHAMADAIGMDRRWHQKPPKASWSHYDVSITKKNLAIARGAILTDRWGALEFKARMEGNTALIERIAASRARKQTASKAQ